jgi:hypothetical protein
VVTAMLKQGGGRILFTASIAGPGALKGAMHEKMAKPVDEKESA